MRNLTSKLRLSLKSFGRNEGGAVVAEAVIVLPLFLWAYIALFVYWDSFRSMNTIQKAAFTISDMISREQTGITTAYVNGMSKTLEFLIDDDQQAKLRVSSLTWSAANNRFEVHWSRSPDNKLPELTNASLQNYASQIPNMSPGDYVIVVEVEVGYKPTFDVGMPDQTFRQFIVTRPRFLPCLPLDTIACPVS